MPIQAPLSPLEKTLSQATLKSSQNAQSVESLESTFSKADSMDCHAVQAPFAMTAAQTKSTRLSLSLACAIALSSAVLIPNQAKADWANMGSSDGSSFDQSSNCTGSCTYSFIFYRVDSSGGRGLIFGQNASANILTFTVQSDGHQGWRNVKLNAQTTITTVNATGRFKLEFKASGSGNNSTLTTINNRAERLNLRADDSAKLTVTTLNQDTANGDSQIFKNVSVDTFDLNSGKSYQYDGTVGTLNITNGEYRQGINDVNNVVPDTPNNGNQNFGSGGTITTVNLQGGEFKQGKGTITDVNLSGGSFTQQVTPNPQARSTGQSTQTQSPNITNLNQSGGTFTQQNGTIGTLNLKGGVFNHNGGTLTTIDLQDGNGVFNNNAQNTNFTITQSGGDHTIGGKITNFTQNAAQAP